MKDPSRGKSCSLNSSVAGLWMLTYRFEIQRSACASQSRIERSTYDQGQRTERETTQGDPSFTHQSLYIAAKILPAPQIFIKSEPTLHEIRQLSLRRARQAQGIEQARRESTPLLSSLHSVKRKRWPPQYVSPIRKSLHA